MSVQALSWVIENANVRANNYLVLLMVANRADEYGNSAWPSVEWLAQRARLSERTVQRCIRKLMKAGELVVEEKAGPRGTNQYHIPMQASFGVGGDKLSPRQWRPKGVTRLSPDTSLSVLRTLPLPPPARAGGGHRRKRHAIEAELRAGTGPQAALGHHPARCLCPECRDRRAATL